MPMASGGCRYAIKRYFYNSQQRRCEEFYYGGCGGNKNNFKTKAECLTACHKGKVCISSLVTWIDFLTHKALIIVRKLTKLSRITFDFLPKAHHGLPCNDRKAREIYAPFADRTGIRSFASIVCFPTFWSLLGISFIVWSWSPSDFSQSMMSVWRRGFNAMQLYYRSSVQYWTIYTFVYEEWQIVASEIPWNDSCCFLRTILRYGNEALVSYT